MIDNRLRLFPLLAAASGFLAVILGAFGAHALKSALSPALVGVWQTAVHYQMFHTLALFVIAVLPARPRELRLVKLAGWLFVVGIALFCGSLYVVVLTGLGGLGAVTPLGGAAFLAGWGCLAVALAGQLRDGN